MAGPRRPPALTAADVTPPRRWWWRVLRDPITHFAILGGALFGLNAAVAGDERPMIAINAAAIAATLRERAALLGRPPSIEERRDVIETLTRDEVLLQEAYRRGYDKSPRIRAQMIQTMQLVLSDDPSEPDEATLRTYYAANRARFGRPDTLDLTQLFQRDGDASATELPDRLNATTAIPAGAVRIANASHDDLVRQYGPNTAGAINAFDDLRWYGPFRGSGGVYYLRVVGRRPARIPDFEEVAPAIAGEWALNRQRDIIRERVAELGRSYRIVAPSEP